MGKSTSITSSLVWKFSERFSVQIVQFVVSIIIARILLPEQYGAMAILNIFITISSTIVQSGLSQYLIQKKDVDTRDYSTVLWSSFIISIIIYGILFFTAPYIAQFFKLRELAPMLRILSIVLFITPLSSVQMAYVRRNMLFGRLTVASLLAAICSGLSGVVAALNGCGTWSLILQQLVYHVLTFLILYVIVSWRPVIAFEMEIAKQSFSFGVKLLTADLVDKLYHSIVNIIIGRKFSPSILAFFDRGKQFPLILIDNIDGSVQSVMYPAYSRLQDSPVEMKILLRKSIRMSSYLSFISMALLFVLAKSLIYILLGDKWLPCQPFLQAYCIITMLFPFQTTLLQSFIALGKSQLYFNITLLKRLIGAALLISVVFISKSVYLIILVCFIIELCAILINLFPSKKYLNYSFGELLCDIAPNLFLSFVVISVGLLLNCIIQNYYLSFILVSFSSFILIVVLSIITKNDSYYLIYQKLGVSRIFYSRKK